MSYLQAFADVNKRTARLCANIPLITMNLVPLSFNAIEVDDYMSAMISVYELQDVRPLIDLYIYGMGVSVDQLNAWLQLSDVHK